MLEDIWIFGMVRVMKEAYALTTSDNVDGIGFLRSLILKLLCWAA